MKKKIPITHISKNQFLNICIYFFKKHLKSASILKRLIYITLKVIMAHFLHINFSTNLHNQS